MSKFCQNLCKLLPNQTMSCQNYQNILRLLLISSLISTISTESTIKYSDSDNHSNNNDDLIHQKFNHQHHHNHQQQHNDNNQRLQFIVEPETIWAAPDGRRVSFKCQASPSSAQIRWLLNGTIMNDDNYNINNGYDWIKISDNKLSIKLQKSNINDSFNNNNGDNNDSKTKSSSLAMNLQGAVFQCLAEWNQQVIVSQPAKLIIAELLPFDDSSEQQQIINISAIAGNNVIIPCQLPHSIPLAVAEFEFNNNITITANNISQDRYRILPSGQLLIQNVRPYDSGTYRCIAHNPFLQEKMYANHVIQLKILKAKHSTNDLKSLRFMLQPKQQMTAIIGSNITFECVANGYPVPKIMWTKIGGNEMLPKSRTFITNGIMMITTVQKDDEGIYSCTASNSKSTVEANTELKIYEMPEIVQDDYELIEMEIGQNYDIHCDARGQPKPLISWLHNGYFIDSQITNDVFFEQDGSILKIIGANPQLHQGIYQCFATNELGTTYAIKVIQFKSINSNYHAHNRHHHHHHHGHNHNRFIDNNNFNDNDNNNNNSPMNYDHNNDFVDHHSNHDNADDESGARINQQHHHNHKKKHGKQHGKDLKLIPPSRPEVSRLNDDSVMVRWHVPKTTGLPVQFFKVQYKELGHGDWNTVDIEIPAHIYSYPVCCLNINSAYRFRIAAVYSNDDNKIGKSSNKFVFHKDPQMKRPTNSPTILNATSVSPNEIIVQWEYLNIDQQQVDGFFINYRSTDSAGQYLMVTALGADSRQQNIPHLQPNTAYEIKMQCFNEAGTSDFSNIYTIKTMSSATNDSKDINDDNDFDNDDTDDNNNQLSSSSRPSPTTPILIDKTSNHNANDDDYIFGMIMKPKWLQQNDQYWLAIVIIIITITLFIISCSIICCLRQQKSNSNVSSTVTDSTTKLKLENSNHHHYFNAINGLIQEQQQNRRLSSNAAATTTTSSPISKTSVITNGHHHHHHLNNHNQHMNSASGGGLMMLKSNESPQQQQNNNLNNNNGIATITSTTDSSSIHQNDISSCSSPSSKQTPSLMMAMMNNRRNSFRHSTILSHSSYHLSNSNNNNSSNNCDEPNNNNINQNHHLNHNNHHQITEQINQQQQTATIDRKRSLKNSIPESYLDAPQQQQQHHQSTISSLSTTTTTTPSIISNGNVIQKMNHHQSFTRLNGTLERKRRSRHDLSTINAIGLLNNNNNGMNGINHLYNSRTNISNNNNNNNNGSSTMVDMYNIHHHHHHKYMNNNSSNSNTNTGYYHSNNNNNTGSNNGNNFVIMQSSC